MSATRRPPIHRAGWVLLLVLSVGCERTRTEEPAGAGAAEEKTAQVTVWSDRFEVFLEHRFVIAGTPTPFVTHITNLVTLEPRREGVVRFGLRSGSEPPIEYVESAPKRPGIYLPELTFPRAGEWSVTLRIPTGEGESLVALPPLLVYASREDAARGREPEAPEEISFLKEQQWKVLTRTEPAGTRRMVERLRLAGVVSVCPGSRAAVTPPLAGRLLAAPDGSLPSLGDRVAAGQTLALVQPPFSDFAVKLADAEAEVIRTKLAAEHAERTHHRVQQLAAQNAKSERELREAEFALATARASHEAALSVRAAYEHAGAIFVRPATPDGRGLAAVELRAPISGTVVRVTASVGEHVSSDKAVFEILDTGTVFIEAHLPESEIGRLGTSRAATYETMHDRDRFVPILGDGGGRLVFFGREVDPATRTVPLVYEVPNPEGRLRIGMALGLHVETARAEDALAVPVSAVVEEDGRPIAYVQVSGETFQKRELTLGIRDGDFVQVVAGVSAGERVVTKEAYAIRLASVSTAIPAHDHAH